jgi:putative peptidoglycan lipid II flippase
MLLGTFLATVWQFYLIMGKVSLRYRFQFYHLKLKEIFRNSFKMKLSSILYDSKEPLFATIFLSLGEGVYSLYNYAIKFSAAIFQVTNTPSINRYLTELNSLVAKREYGRVEPLVKNVLFNTVPFFLLVTLSFYFVMPLFLELTFGNKLNSESVTILESIFIYMSLYYLAIVFEAPYTNSMAILKIFNFNLLVNALFALFMLFIYLLFKGFTFDYRVYLIILIVAQVSNLLLFYRKNRAFIGSKL